MLQRRPLVGGRALAGNADRKRCRPRSLAGHESCRDACAYLAFSCRRLLGIRCSRIATTFERLRVFCPPDRSAAALALVLAVMSCAFISLAGHLPAGTGRSRPARTKNSMAPLCWGSEYKKCPIRPIFQATRRNKPFTNSPRAVCVHLAQNLARPARSCFPRNCRRGERQGCSSSRDPERTS